MTMKWLLIQHKYLNLEIDLSILNILLKWSDNLRQKSAKIGLWYHLWQKRVYHFCKRLYMSQAFLPPFLPCMFRGRECRLWSKGPLFPSPFLCIDISSNELSWKPNQTNSMLIYKASEPFLNVKLGTVGAFNLIWAGVSICVLKVKFTSLVRMFICLVGKKEKAFANMTVHRPFRTMAQGG